MTTPQWTEQQEAGASGPRALNEPGSPVWCWQTISHLQTLWKTVDIDLRLYEKTWDEAEEHRVWEKVPYEQPYGSKEKMLEALEVGDVPAARAKVAGMAMNATPTRHGKRNLTDRIAYDAPDVWERMKRGEFKSVAEAARVAGIEPAKPNKTITLSDKVERVAERLKGYYSQEQIRQLREHLGHTNG